MLAPTTEAELADAIKTTSGPLRVRGGGTRPIGKPVAGEVLSVVGLSGIELYEPGALTIVAKAGTPLAEIEAALAAENQHLPFEPMDHRAIFGTDGTPTIGGVVAGNVSGPRRIQVGACRDSLIGVRFVDGHGTAIKNGGRVMKNVTGYDLVKLMCGAYGTLGVLSEVSFKVLPGVEACSTLLIDGLSVSEAVAAMSKALGSPYEVSAAAHVVNGVDGAPVTMLRLEGFVDSVAYRAGKLQALLGAGNVESDLEKTQAGWKWVRDGEKFAGTAGDLWRISVKPSDAPGIVAALGTDEVLLDWGGGLIWAELPAGTDARAKIGAFNGHATLVRASEATRATLNVFQPEPATLAAITKGLRDRFDPRGLLNPGLMG
jgi:glycolate oxidase FAD binding subunit